MLCYIEFRKDDTHVEKENAAFIGRNNKNLQQNDSSTFNFKRN